MIATWRMAVEGITEGAEILQNGGSAAEAIIKAVSEVEDFPYYKSVGYGGLPNSEMDVELDAAYMNGTTLDFGAVGAVKDFANPIQIAQRLSVEKSNNFLVGVGAEKFAAIEGFERKTMLTDRAKIHYKNRMYKLQAQENELSPYSGHDTVGMVALDETGLVTVGTSTSGLFMKKPGRVGDSPVIGSGFYADSEIGGASATGLGEDLMKGMVSYQIVSLMGAGRSPQEACEKVVAELDQRLKERRGEAGDLSVVAMDKDGNYGVATNIEGFSFAVVTENEGPEVYLVDKLKDGRCSYEKASQEWLDEYMRRRTAPMRKAWEK